MKDKIELRDFNFKEITNLQDKSINKELKEKVEEGYYFIPCIPKKLSKELIMTNQNTQFQKMLQYFSHQ